MKKTSLALAALAVLCSSVLLAAPQPANKKNAEKKPADTYKLKYTEDFKGKKVDAKLWKRIPPGKADWKSKMAPDREDLVTVKNGIVSIHGILNDGKDPNETREILTGGIMTKDLYVLQYGKIEFKLKFEDGQKGAWPAVWMLPQDNPKGWPAGGEIDIFERLNSDNFVYQTLHYGVGDPPAHKTHGGRGNFKKGDWNVYGFEWTPDSLAWTINGKETYRYNRTEADVGDKFPWTTPFYLMIDMQLGGKWVGGVDKSTLPVAMHVDWVKFYQLYRDGKPVGHVGKPK